MREVYNTERHLLHVGCTRARDHLLVTGGDPVSEFLVDMAREQSIEDALKNAASRALLRCGRSAGSPSWRAGCAQRTG
jgi:hypothetical protein